MQTAVLPVVGHGDAVTRVWGGSGARQGDGVVVLLLAGVAGFTGSAAHAPAQTEERDCHVCQRRTNNAIAGRWANQTFFHSASD